MPMPSLTTRTRGGRPRRRAVSSSALLDGGEGDEAEGPAQRFVGRLQHTDAATRKDLGHHVGALAAGAERLAAPTAFEQRLGPLGPGHQRAEVGFAGSVADTLLDTGAEQYETLVGDRRAFAESEVGRRARGVVEALVLGRRQAGDDEVVAAAARCAARRRAGRRRAPPVRRRARRRPARPRVPARRPRRRGRSAATSSPRARARPPGRGCPRAARARRPAGRGSAGRASRRWCARRRSRWRRSWRRPRSRRRGGARRRPRRRRDRRARAAGS